MDSTTNEAQMAIDTETVQMISVQLLRPHPKNPRVALREDVVDAITADLEERGHMESRHAITVRAAEAIWMEVTREEAS